MLLHDLIIGAGLHAGFEKLPEIFLQLQKAGAARMAAAVAAEAFERCGRKAIHDLDALRPGDPQRAKIYRAVVELYDGRFHIRRIDLLGSTVSIYGKGEIASTGEVDLSFLTGISRLTVPSIPVVGDVLKAAQKQLMLVTVRGTVGDPKLEVQPVAPVTNTVKALLADIFGASKPAAPLNTPEGATR